MITFWFVWQTIYLANIGVSGRLHDVCKRLSFELSIERFGNAPDMSLRLPLHPLLFCRESVCKLLKLCGADTL